MALCSFNHPVFSGFDDDFFGLVRPSHGFALARAQSDTRGIPLDIVERDNKFELKADLPGVDKKDVKLHVEGDVLSLSIEQQAGKEEDKEEAGVKYHRVERSSTYQRRSVRLPDSADLDKITAKLEHGVLSLEVPKALKQEPRSITVD